MANIRRIPVWLLELPAAVTLVSAVLMLTVPGQLCAVHTIRADDRTLRLAAESGFWGIVQLLEWREVEPAPDEFYWEYPDFLVHACGYYGLALVLRLDHPPPWALLPGDSPPVGLDAYASFVHRVAGRYRGRVRAYIIWNEPNLSREWAGQPPDPEGYAQLLRRGVAAVREGDPKALVLAAGLAPTSQNDAEAMDDLAFLAAVLESEAWPSVDALAVHPYGFGYPPTAPADEHNGLVFARLEQYRALLLGHGGIPLWATECGWTVGPTSPEDAWQVVSPEQQALYLTQAVRLTGERYPWLRLLAVWNLAQGLPEGDEMAGYSLLAPDGTERPALSFLQEQPQLRLVRLRRAQVRLWRRVAPPPRQVQVLAPDVVVRLSDVDTAYPHWAKPYGGRAPSRRWQGSFYLDNPGWGPWRLYLETMQVEEGGNLVLINGQPLLPPALPVSGRAPFASTWTTVSLDVPPGLLQPGINVIEVRLSPRLHTQQDVRYESMQFRGVCLRRD